MNDKRPVWLLDIDGVINAVTRHWPPDRGWDVDHWSFQEFPSEHFGRMWPIKTSQKVIDFISEIHASGLVEIRWHTTWQHSAQELAVTLGLPVFEVMEAPEYFIYTEDAKGWWKLPAARRVLEKEGRHLLWTDDEIDYSMSRHERKELRAMEPGAFLLSPDAACGLAPRDLERIRLWLKNIGDDSGMA